MSSFWDRPGGHNQYIAAVLASLSVFNFGVTIGWSAPSVFAVTDKKYYGFAVRLTEYGWACAMANLGCSLTMVPAAALANCIGRKLIMLLVVPPYIAGWVLTMYPFNMYLLMFSRLLQGLCAGCYTIIASVYCVEISQVEVKPYIGNFPLIFYYLGILYAYILGAFNNMRYLNYGCAVTPAVFLLTFVWMPESPVYYMLKNKKMKAIGSLQWLRGKHMDAAREYDDIMGAIERLRDNNKFSCQKLRRLASAKAIIICTIMVAFKNLCGSIAIIMYSTLMLDAADSQIFMDSKVSIIFIGISVLISTLISVHKFDSRRTLMIWSIIMVALNCALQSIYFQMKDNYVHSLQWLPIPSHFCA
ncbi:PREDICTED: facilitated trehalose transporter Tret1-2 homolog [Drosophila arizonae]|uniref:Facilitated trehalose transporter Tret1-2 homolog n=1 Tax=Drosophila arizonae TaxID=7263 RepID=A0ABM1PC28_DROAR|nr:PREDICTED: facilitated trehalose transporter Tret1-2 homolog [Drosophila arizonae]